MTLIDGLVLPQGIHEHTIEEIKEEFGKTERRKKMLVCFEKWLEETTGKIGESNILSIYVDGSFTTHIDRYTNMDERPTDLDVIVNLLNESVMEENLLEINEVHEFTLDIKYTYPGDEWNSIWWKAFENFNTKDIQHYENNAKKGYIELKAWRKS